MLMTDHSPQDHVFNIETALDWHLGLIANGLLPFWVVHYNSPRYPHIYHARAWSVPAHGNGSVVQPQPYLGIIVAPTLETIRALLPPGMTNVPRARDDDWHIVERWLS